MKKSPHTLTINEMDLFLSSTGMPKRSPSSKIKSPLIYPSGQEDGTEGVLCLTEVDKDLKRL